MEINEKRATEALLAAIADDEVFERQKKSAPPCFRVDERYKMDTDELGSLSLLF